MNIINMAQTTEIFPRLKQIYKSVFRFKVIQKFSIKCISFIVDKYASFRSFNFPDKFSWDWKLEMLLLKYEEETVCEFKKIIKPGMTVVDIGAHIGYFTALFSKLVGKKGRVIAFEADNDNYNLLKKNVRRRNNISIYHLAISDQIGIIDFFKTIDRTGSHSIVSSDFRPTKVTVSSETLDNFLAELSINQVDIIKMDIEGGEPFAIKGMAETLKQNRKLKLIMEFSPENLRIAGFEPLEVLDNFSKLGFSLKSIEDNELCSVTRDKISEIENKKHGCVNLLIFRSND